MYYSSTAMPDPNCPCCPIALLSMYAASLGPDTCCVCDFYAASGTQSEYESEPIPLPADPQDLISTEVNSPTDGRLYVSAAVDVVRDPASNDTISVMVQLAANGQRSKMQSESDEGVLQAIPPGSQEMGYSTTIILQNEFAVESGKTIVSLIGRAGTGAVARAGSRNLNITFVPNAEAGPLSND
jgi:hypothetical protein